MAHKRATFDDLDDSIPPRFDFNAANVVPGVAARSNLLPVTIVGLSKPLIRNAPNLQALSPRARAVNAAGTQQTKDKGKGKAKVPDIIELSDSSDDESDVILLPSRPQIGQASTSKANGSRAQAARLTGSVTHSPAEPSGSSRGAVRPSAVGECNGVEEAPTPAPRPRPLEEPRIVDTPIQTPEEKIVSAVQEVIPDVDPDHVLARYHQYKEERGDAVLGEDPLLFVQSILHYLFENPDYPKVSKKRKRDEQEAGPSKKRKSENVIKLDITKTDRPRITSGAYSDLSLYWLGVTFASLRKDYLKRIFNQYSCFFAPTFVYLRNLESTNTVPVEGKKKNRTRPLLNGPPWQSVEFDRELQWTNGWQPGKSGVIQFIQADAGGNVGNNESEEEKIESVECEKPGTGIDCGCCFSEYVAETMVQCPDGHMFCKSCIHMFCQERLGQRNAKIKCMDQTTCEAEFAHAQLKLVLPPKLLSLYERIKQEEEITAAGLEGLEECPFCDFKCVIENDMERLFRCLNDECGVVSCRQCKKKDHLPRTCAEAEEDTTLNAQHAVEEAMTNALMRKCPKCQATFIKTDGCNKITCTKCGQLSCYICRKAITGYDHFNEQPGGHPRQRGKANNTKCPLWDGNGGVPGGNGLDQRHHQEVLRAREVALAAMREDQPEVDMGKVRVDAPDVPRAQRLPLPQARLPPPALPRGRPASPPPVRFAQPYNPMPAFQQPMYGPVPPQIYYQAGPQAVAYQQVYVPQMVPVPNPALPAVPYPGRYAAPPAARCGCPNCRAMR